MSIKVKTSIFSGVFLVTFLGGLITYMATDNKDSLYVIPLIILLITFLVYNFFQVQILKIKYKVSKKDIDKIKEKRLVILISMAIELFVFIFGLILYFTL